MPEDIKRKRPETEAIIIGYAMSGLDSKYLPFRGYSTWRQAFAEAAKALSQPPATFKNLRDEFDPVHSNPRAGWHKRPLRSNRRRILDELYEVSEDALMEFVARTLNREEEATSGAIDSIIAPTRIVYNVAERLLTGRRAEEYFLENCKKLIDVKRADIIDYRQAAYGFDFGVKTKPECAIEVKGLKKIKGGILFTDREWAEAKLQRNNYWIVVVGNLEAIPMARIIRDPHNVLDPICSYQRSVTAVWRSTVSVLS